MRPSGESPARDVQEFCRVFPDAFVVSDRPPYFDLKGGSQGRPLSAGFHLMQGYFRDDAPLCELVLDQAAGRELDSLWRELNFVTGAPMRQYHDFIFFERAEPPRYMRESAFDFARSEDKDSISESKIQQLRDAYLAKAKKRGVKDEADQSDRDVLRRNLARDSPGRARPACGRALPSRGLAEVRRACLSPAAFSSRGRRSARLLSLAAREGRALSRRRDSRHGRERAAVASLCLSRRPGRARRGRAATLEL